MKDTNIDFDIEVLSMIRELASPAIFNFNDIPSHLKLPVLLSFPGFTLSTTLPFDDHHAPPQLRELDAYVDTLLLAGGQLFQEK